MEKKIFFKECVCVCVCVRLGHFAVQKKLTQHCKSTILQLIFLNP